MLTVQGALLAQATQPAALSATLLIALGIMQTARDGIIVMLCVLLLTAIVEPLRCWRIKNAPPAELAAIHRDA